MTPIIRRATPDDAHELLDLIREHAAFECGVASVSLVQLQALLAMPKPPSRIWVADRGNLAGYAALTVDFALWSGDQFGQLDCLYVRPEHRGYGTGRQLFQAVASAAISAGMKRLEWQTPLWNEEALLFYGKMGAVSSHKHRFHKHLCG